MYVLKRDMIPIFVDPDRGAHGANFKCPVPACHDKVIEEIDSDTLFDDIIEMAEEINRTANNYEEPFDRFKNLYNIDNPIWMSNIHADGDEGLTGVWVGRDINSGDIYRTSDGMAIFNHAPVFMQEIFDEKEGFFCHNVDNYFQAFTNREMCIRYFNYILDKAEELEIDIVKEKE